MIYRVATLATGQVDFIAICITEVWYELDRATFKNPPDVVINAEIAHAILNAMVATMKIAWSEAPMGNTRT